MNDIERAASCFKDGFNCSQSVLSTYGTKFGLSRETSLRIASGFGGGMGRMGKTCGAVTGAFIVIGLRYGGAEAGAGEAKEETYRAIGEFAKRFASRNGSIMCRELIDCDISTPEGYALAKERNVFETICTKLIRDAAE
ncbi:MAG: C_GCAxxG_C_C family protein, partial [Candidatus Krumholzibacteria bacterium]|nr:C_GCAxxG_C_C family protein [Candidatus Krumholzibacteria bacterium]